MLLESQSCFCAFLVYLNSSLFKVILLKKYYYSFANTLLLALRFQLIYDEKLMKNLYIL